MIEVTVTRNYSLVFLIAFLLLLFILYRYKIKFDTNNIIDYFIYLTNKILLFFMMINSLIIFLLNFQLDYETQITPYINEVFLNMLFYILLSYSIYYFLKGILSLIQFTKDTDLFGRETLQNIKFTSSKDKGGNRK